MREVTLANDKIQFNVRYRKALMNGLRRHGVGVRSEGLLDNIFYFVYLIFTNRERVWISSNIKTNLLCAALRPTNSVIIILNGLGRKRQKRWFRIIVAQIILKRAKIVLIQNYADYRYFRRYSGVEQKLKWICGSGGSKRNTGTHSGMFVVSRDNKMNTNIDSLSEFISLSSVNQLNVVGVTVECVQKLPVKTNFNYNAIGFVDQCEIFFYGHQFIQLSGYGEGFPHTLADAIVSGLEVIINKNLFVQFGLHKLGYEHEQWEGQWGKVSVPKTVKPLAEEHIIEHYLEQILPALKSGGI